MSTFTITQTPDDNNLYLYPDGSSSTQCISSGSLNHHMIDDTYNNADDDTTYVYTTNIGSQYDFYTITNHTDETGSINYVSVVSTAKSHTNGQSSSGTYELWIKDSTSGSSVSSQVDHAPLSTSYKKYYHNFTSSPTGASWDWNAIDNLIIGFECSSPTVTSANQTLTLRPTGDSDCNLSSVGATNNYECVDDTTVNDNNYVAETGPGGTTNYDLYTANDHTDEYGTINSITIYNRIYGTGGDPGGDAGHTYIKIGGTTASGDWVYPNGSYTNISKEYSSSITSASAWTWAEVDSLLIGTYLSRGASGGNSRTTQVYAVVDYTESANPEIRTTQCYAVVNYTPSTSTVTLNMPSNINVSHSRNVKRFTFPDGSYEIADCGRSGKTITLEGVQNSDSSTKMDDIKDMAHNGSIISITGLPDSYLNTDYLIRDFSWSESSGHGDTRVYSWSMVLEES